MDLFGVKNSIEKHEIYHMKLFKQKLQKLKKIF